MKKFSTIFSGIATLISLLVITPGTASANGNLTIVVKNPNPYTGNHSWFTFEKKPGDVIEDVAVVKNLGDTPIKAHVYAVDATSNDAGSFILKLENEDRNGIGKWTKTSLGDDITIPANQYVDFPFHIEIPKDLAPGQYFGGIIVEEVAESPKTVQVAAAAADGNRICCTNILVKTRIGLRIYLTIPGTIHDKLEWSALDVTQNAKSTNFHFQITNQGNVALEPVASIDIFDGMGNHVDHFEKSLGESLPGTNIGPEVSWEKQPFIGNFKAVTKVSYTIKDQGQSQPLHSAAGVLTKTVTFWVTPWKMLIIIFALMAAAFAGFVWYKNYEKNISLNWISYQLQPDENIITVAKAHQLDWKKLAHINKLQAPYLLTAGQTILVPKTKTPAPQNPQAPQGEQTLSDNNRHE